MLCLLAVARSWWGTRLDGFTVDEPWHAVAGAVYLRDNDFSLNPEHPPLVKLAAGTAMAGTLRLPEVIAPSEKAQERELVERTMFLDNDPAAAQRRTRAALWTFNALLLLAFGLLVRRAFGLPWALGTLAFLAIDPSIGAHLPVVMTDLPLALTLAVAAMSAGLLAATWRWRWVLAAGVAVGLALGSKHSAIAGLAGIGLLLLVAVAVAWRRGGLHAGLRSAGLTACVGVLAVAVVWLQYGAHFHAGPDGSDRFNRSMEDKVADLHIPAWRALIGTADHLQLVPRPYLWGLADTVRAGVEGRGPPETRLWGTLHKGSPPWFTWPSIVAGKLPLALLALAALGAAALPWLHWTPTARWALAAVLAMGTTHLLALGSSQGTYGGIRHALPMVFVLAVLAGATLAVAWQRRARPLQASGVGLLALALATTLPEPRLWEFHNTLAGGSRDAWRQFSNEGLDLGQRYNELHAFYLQRIGPSGERFYLNTWMPDSQLKGGGMPLGNYVMDLDDRNVAGRYEGYFVYDTWDHHPYPDRGWNPAEAFAGLRQVARFGNLEVWHGRQQVPVVRASSLYNRVIESIYRDGNDDWALVAARLAEVMPVLPFHVGAGIELGNAHLRLGDRIKARAAYRALLEHEHTPLDALIRQDLRRQVAALADEGIPLQRLRPLRNPWIE